MKSISVLFYVILSLSMAQAASTWKMDPYHSNVNFEIKHLMSKITGRFNTVMATAQLDENEELTSVEVEIEVASIYTAVVARDNHLRTADFFDVAKYPKSKFKSTSIKKVGDNLYEIVGDLTLKGITKPVTLDLKYLGVDQDQLGNTKKGFRAETKINRSDFGVSFNILGAAGTAIVGEEVLLVINGQAVK